MKKHTLKRLTQSLLLVSSVAVTASRLEAADLNLFGTNVPPLDFHGFASQGFLGSTKYDYLGDTKDGSFKFTEAGFNVAMNPFPRTRITAQGFLFDVGEVGKYDLTLDYASIQYTFNDAVGVRAGRIRRPQGIYNDIQDVDLARTSVLLPQGVYDSRFRDFYLALDGGELFGDIPLNKAGDLSYEVYAGMLNPSMDGGAAAALRNEFPSFVHLDSINSAPMFGVQLWYNTPVNGLRFGAAGAYLNGVDINSTIFGTIHSTTQLNFPVAQGSAEYLWKAWTFQAEYLTFIEYSDPGTADRVDAWYASAAYRFNKWFEAGTYYTEYYADTGHRDDSTQYQKDAALTLRFDLKSWWVFKVEGHYIRGTGLLEDNTSNPVQNDDGWFMLALKTTFSF